MDGWGLTERASCYLCASHEMCCWSTAPGNWTLSCVKTITFSAPNRWFLYKRYKPSVRSHRAGVRRRKLLHTSWSLTSALQITHTHRRIRWLWFSEKTMNLLRENSYGMRMRKVPKMHAEDDQFYAKPCNFLLFIYLFNSNEPFWD